MASESVELFHLVEQIHKAITENTEKEATIQRVLGSRTFAERQIVVTAYKDAYKKNVREYFTGAFTSNYNRLVYRLCLTRTENAAFWVRDSAKGWFCTDERALVGLLITYTADELRQLEDTYKNIFDRRRPQDDIAAAASFDFRILLEELWNKQRQPAQDSSAKGEAMILFRSTEARAGTNEREMCRALCSGPREYLQKVLMAYEGQGQEETFDKCVMKETSGWFRTGLLMLIEWIENPARFYAREIHHALNGWFTVNHLTLRNYIVDRSEIDIRDISMAYEEIYARTLEDAIQAKTTGAYRNLLVAIVTRPATEPGTEKTQDLNSPHHNYGAIEGR